MSDTEILIKNGTIVTTTEQIQTDIHVIGEKIHRIGKWQGAEAAPGQAPVKIIDATGCYIFPGGIDAHTHMELPLPRTVSSDSFESGTLAALHGGTTTIIDFANQIKGHSALEAVDLWHHKADDHAACDYAFHVSITDFNEKTRHEMRDCIEKHGISSFKTFTAYKGTNMIDDREMIEVMEEVKRIGGIITVHAENGDLIDHLIARNRAQGNISPRFHPLSRPAIAEAEAVGRITDLAIFIGSPAYIVHLSCGEALRRVRDRLLQNKGKSNSPVFVETCPQYLLLDDSLYSREGFEGAKYVLSPPLRTPKDQEALWEGLSDGAIQVVATDHCPFTMEQRRLGENDFSTIPNGIPGVEHRMELLYSEGVAQGRITLQQFVAMTSTTPAQIFGLYPRKGTITAGADADLVIFDPRQEHILSARTHHMNVDYSVYEGRKVKGKCRTVILRGTIAVDDGQNRIGKGFGKYLPRTPFGDNPIFKKR